MTDLIRPDAPVPGEDVPHRPDIAASTRSAGWCGPRQARFLEAIADGCNVREACRLVGLSPASAYAFRRRAKGRAFDLGWKAADLLAREIVAADLQLRANQGQQVTINRADGSTVTKHHYDNRLAVTMLNRLDRYADASEGTAPGHAARLVASDFDAYLQLVEAEGGPARAGLFMLSHHAAAGAGEGPAAELEPVLALARADRLIRCGTADVSVADLDPARRAECTGEQWLRAEAAGVVALAPPPAPAGAAATCQPVSTSGADPSPDPRLTAGDLRTIDKLRRLGLGVDGAGEPQPEPEEASLLNGPVWWYETEREWRTRFPPRAGFIGYESHDYGHPDYERTLTPDEEAVAMRRLRDVFGVYTLEEDEAERDRWFCEAGESADPEGIDATPASAADELGVSRPISIDVTGQGRPCPAPGADGESADPISATPPSPAGGAAAPKRPSPFDVEDEAALVLLGGEGAGNGCVEVEQSLTPAPRAKPASSGSPQNTTSRGDRPDGAGAPAAGRAIWAA